MSLPTNIGFVARYGIIILMMLSFKSFAQLTLNNIADARSTLANAPRKVICNSDCNDVTYESTLGTPAGLLVPRAGNVPGTQIDTYVYSTGLGIPLVVHNTSVGEVFTSKSAPYENNIAPDLINLGTDALEVVTNYMRQNDVEIFYSQRMNDWHDVNQPLIMSQFKTNHPEFLVGNEEDWTDYGIWTAVDYSHSEVRALVFDLVEEVCNNYDIDGVELDFFRQPLFFKSVADGALATQAQCDLITDLLEDIRLMADTRGVARQRPILISVHIPDSIDYCKDIGLDVEEWVSEGLIDIIVTGGEFRFNPVASSVTLATAYDIPVWPCLSAWKNAPEELKDYRRFSHENWRGRVMNVWDSGCSAVYTFNYEPSPYHLPRYSEIGSIATLEGLNKIFFCAMGGWDPEFFVVNGSQYETLPALTPKVPETINPGTPFSETIYIGDDIAGDNGEAIGIIHFGDTNVDLSKRLVLEINEQDQGTGTEVIDSGGGSMMQFSLDEADVLQGENEVEVSLKAWDEDYTAGDLPQSPWRSDIDGTNTTFIDSGKLHIIDNCNDYAYYYYNWGLTPEEQEVVIEARLKVISSAGGVSISVRDGRHSEGLIFETNRIRTYHSGLTYYMNTTSSFHNYKIVVKGQSIKIYVDGILRIDGEGQFTYPTTDNRLVFGSAGGTSTGESLWEYVRYCITEKDSLSYQATKLPGWPWYSDIDGTNTTYIDSDQLHIIDNCNDYAYYYHFWNLVPESGGAVEARLKVISSAGGVSIGVRDGTHKEGLIFETDRIRTFLGGLTYYMDTTDDFHTYKVIICGDDIYVYVDGVLRINGAGQFTYPTTDNMVIFGSAGGTSTGESLWEYVKVKKSSTSSNFFKLNDIIVSVDYD